MYTKADLLKTIKLETRIIKHLATQVPEGQLEYRPTAKQRSTLELLQYLTYTGAASCDFALTASWDGYERYSEAAKQVTPATFAKAMDKQAATIAKLLAKSTDATLRKKIIKTWSGTKVTLGEGLVEMVLKPLVAYRMQLFLYAKASGAAHLSTSDAWTGKPAKQQKQAAG